MKKYFPVLLVLMFALQTPAVMLSGEVKYSVADVRNSLVSQIPQGIDYNLIKTNIADKNYLENSVYLLKGRTDLKDRTLAYFSDGSYALNYKDDILHVFYYNSDGVLTHAEEKLSCNYPYKAYKYKINGKMENMSYRVSESETFIFTKDKKLIAHWKGNNCYDENNNIIMTRYIRE